MLDKKINYSLFGSESGQGIKYQRTKLCADILKDEQHCLEWMDDKKTRHNSILDNILTVFA